MTTLLEVLILSFVISLDSFMSAFSYGVTKIKIPFLSAFLMSFTGVLTLFFSCCLGGYINDFLSEQAIKYIAFALMFVVGLYKLLSEIIKSLILRKIKKENKTTIKILNKTINCEKFLDPKKKDVDNNKILSPLECLGLGFILSIDNLGVGFSYGLQKGIEIILLAISFLLTLISIISGNFLGKKLSKFAKINLSYLSGLTLIALSILKLFI